MQYEKVILEMLSRIQTLEEQVKELQKKQAASAAPILSQVKPTPRRVNTKVTDKMIEACYRAGRKAYENDQLEIAVLADQVNAKTGMNRSNALMTIFAVIALLKGELYKRAASGKAVEKFFNYILEDYGKSGLQRAIAALRMHIDYRRTFHHNVDLLERLCDRYQKQI